MKKLFFLLIALLLVNLAVCYEGSIETYHYEDILEEEEDGDEDALFFKDTFRRVVRVVSNVGSKIVDKLKEATNKFADAVKKGFDAVSDLVNGEDVKAENNLCSSMCPISNSAEQKEKEVIALLASIGSYSSTDKIKKLNQLRTKLGRFGDWNLHSITEIKLARSLILVNDAKRQFVVAFRGTVKTSVKDWVVNLKFDKDQNPWGEGKIHKGFLREVRDVVENSQFSTAVDNYLRKGYSIIITGHSQGAAEASVFGAYIIARYKTLGIPKPSISIVVYAPPRPGDEAFAKWLMRNIPSITRFQNTKDIVPKVPMIAFGFHQVGALYQNICSKTFIVCHSTSRFFYYTRESRWKDHISTQSSLCSDNLVKEVLEGICE